MTIDDMFSNIGTASQCKEIVDEQSVQGAILRSLVQWIESSESRQADVDFMVFELKSHMNYEA